MATDYDLDIRVSTSEVLSDLTRVATDPQQALHLLGDYFHALAAGSKSASVLVSYGQSSGVAASGEVSIDTDLAENDTLVIEASTLTWKNGFATGTVTCVDVDEDDAVTIDEDVFTFKVTSGGDDEPEIGADDAADATALAAAINAVSTTVVATAASNVVHLRAVTTGTGGNSIVLTTTDAVDLAVSGSGNLSGGEAVSSVQVAMAFTGANTIDRTSCATNLAAKINATEALAAIVTATSSAEVVTVTANEKGDIGNFIAISETGAGVTLGGEISSGKLGGGVDTAYLTFTR